MTSENIENIKVRSKATGRTSRIRSEITELTTGTRSEKKSISHQKKSDSVPNCKDSLQKLKTQVFIPNSLEALRFSGFNVSFSVFWVQIKSNPVVFQLFPENDTQVERKFEILRLSNFCFSFHTFPCMELHGSMHFHVWNHMIPWVKLHGRSLGHGSMQHGIVWNHTDHMFPCMELHGNLTNLDPGSLSEKILAPSS